MKKNSFISKIAGNRILIPIVALLILAVFNFIADPSFFKITLGYNNLGNPVLSGYLITILDYGSELAILALGMTLVTAASGGQDISVGAAIAIAGSAMLRVLCGADGRAETLQTPIIVAFLIAVVIAMAFGAFNGLLVAYFKIQPMIATLILLLQVVLLLHGLTITNFQLLMIRALQYLVDLFQVFQFQLHSLLLLHALL